MPELLVPAHVARERRNQIASAGKSDTPAVYGALTEPAPQIKRGRGLGKAVHVMDPAEKIYRQLGLKLKRNADGKMVPRKPNHIPGFRLLGNRVLVAIYERPELTEGGIYLPDTTRREDEHQGKSALILMMGWSAYQSDDQFDFGPDAGEIVPGAWVSLHVADGRKIVVLGTLCRMIRDQDIEMRIPSPDAVY